MTGIDGYDWSPLGGANPVPGDPDAVRVLGRRLRDLADTASAQARLVESVGSETASVWSGPAADAFRTHLGKLPGELAKLVASYHDASDALEQYAVRLGSAQDLAVQALQRATAARAAMSGAQAEATSASARAVAAGSDYTSALAANAPNTASLLAAYRGAQSAVDSANAAVHSAGADLAAAEQMRDSAVVDARRAAASFADAMHAASRAGIQNPHHSWFSSIVSDIGGFFSSAAHQVGQFASGLWDGIEQPLVMLAKLADPLTAPAEIEALAKGIAYGISHPLAFGEAVLDWKDLSSGNVARWLGELAPSVAAAFFTGGAGDVVKGVDGITALERAGVSADDVAALAARGDEEASARIIMRGDDPVPGSIYSARPAQPGRDLSVPGTPDQQIAREAGNFDGPITTTDPVPDSWLGNVHDSGRPLYGDGALGSPARSLQWNAKPSDLLQTAGTDQYVQDFALPPEWGARNEVTILHLPGGSPGPIWDGGTAAQTAADGTRLAGGGHQFLLHNISSDHAIWTGPLPWAKVPDASLAAGGMAKLAGAGGAVRLPSAIQAQP